MKKVLFLIITICTTSQINAQTFKEKAIIGSIGFGISSPYYERNEDAIGGGLYLGAELKLKATSWLELRPYTSFVAVKTDKNEKGELLYKTNVNAILLGGKVRLRAPIPWFSPYAEIGVGTTIGSFETFNSFSNIKKSGITHHIPFSFGVELGRKNKLAVGFKYYFMPEAEQAVGGFVFGYTFPLDKNKKKTTPKKA